ncbi:MAG: NTP transferase domain-containing protein, partial [Planctomycetes bacterium]|nr:NTP transferase domain-containing protein [Planctomycetota bacterium]
SSALPKVLQEICGRALLGYVLDACRTAGARKLYVIVGNGKEAVMERFAADRDVVWVEQKMRKGTAHAVLCCEEHLGKQSGQVLVVAGDMPLVRGETLRALIDEHAITGDAVTLATAVLDEPSGYGRILRDDSGKLADIVEHHDCTPQQRTIREINPSYYCFDAARMFGLLHRIKADNAKGEYYITDSVRIAHESGQGAGAIASVAPEEAMGINSRADLARVGRLMQTRIQGEWMERGVTIVDPGCTWIEHGASIGVDSVIYPFSFVESGAVVEAGQRVGPSGHVRKPDGDDPANRRRNSSPAQSDKRAKGQTLTQVDGAG